MSHLLLKDFESQCLQSAESDSGHEAFLIAEALYRKPEAHKPLSQDRSEGRLGSTARESAVSTLEVVDAGARFTMRCLPVSPAGTRYNVMVETSLHSWKVHSLYSWKSHLCTGLCASENRLQCRWRSRNDSHTLHCDRLSDVSNKNRVLQVKRTCHPGRRLGSELCHSRSDTLIVCLPYHAYVCNTAAITAQKVSGCDHGSSVLCSCRPLPSGPSLYFRSSSSIYLF